MTRVKESLCIKGDGRPVKAGVLCSRHWQLDWVAKNTEPTPHGTLSGYSRFLCRCISCKAANAEASRAYYYRTRRAGA